MTWILFSSPRSPFVRKVMIAAHELGLQGRLERRNVVTTPMNSAPEVLPYNPMGMIPTLLIDDEVVFDSLVIMQRLDEVAGARLFPSGTGQWDCLTRHAVANAATDKAVRILDEQFREQNKDTEIHLSGYATAIRRTISWMEPRLEDGRFDAGDIAFAALLAYLDLRFPHLLWRDVADRASEWYASAEKRPSVRDTAFGDSPFV